MRPFRGIYMSTPNRTICDVLREMRECTKTQNYSYLLGLIEEAQTMANRMEAALWDQNDIEYARKQHKKLKKEIEQMERQKDSQE